MSSSESEEIRKSMNPIFISSWIFGVPRVCYKRSYRIIYSTFLSAIYVSTFSVTYDQRFNALRSFNSAMIMFYVTSQLVAFGGGIGTILFWIRNGANSLEDAITKLSEIDLELKGLGVELEHRKIYRRQNELFLIFFVIWVIIMSLNEYVMNFIGANDNVPIIELICFAYSTYVPHLIIFFGELVFSTIMHSIYQRFQWINETLRQLSKDHDSSREGRTPLIVAAKNRNRNLPIGKTNSTKALLEKIERLYKVHQRLCGITEKVSLNFASLLYLAISVTFGLLVYRLIVLYSLAFLRLEKMSARVVLNVAWIIYYMIKFWMITLTCRDTSAEANGLGIILHGVEIYGEKYQRMLNQFSVELSQNKLHFTAGGFFSIDLYLVNTLISHVTTFIFIFVDVWADTEEEHRKSSSQKTTTY